MVNLSYSRLHQAASWKQLQHTVSCLYNNCITLQQMSKVSRVDGCWMLRIMNSIIVSTQHIAYMFSSCHLCPHGWDIIILTWCWLKSSNIDLQRVNVSIDITVYNFKRKAVTAYVSTTAFMQFIVCLFTTAIDCISFVTIKQFEKFA